MTLKITRDNAGAFWPTEPVGFSRLEHRGAPKPLRCKVVLEQREDRSGLAERAVLEVASRYFCVNLTRKATLYKGHCSLRQRAPGLMGSQTDEKLSRLTRAPTVQP
jgi:hypothetical protein